MSRRPRPSLSVPDAPDTAHGHESRDGESARRAILVFSRAPSNERKSLTSTRLLRPLHTALILKTLQTAARAAETPEDDVDIVLAIDGRMPALLRQAIHGLRQRHLKVYALRQHGEDFNQRIMAALRRSFRMGYRRVVIVGTDTPTLNSRDIRRGLRDPREVTLGPSLDGGFYLAGLSPAHVDLLNALPWGAPCLLTEMRRRLLRSGVSTTLLNPRCDLDTPQQARACWATLWRLMCDLDDNLFRASFRSPKNFRELYVHIQSQTWMDTSPLRGPPPHIAA